MHLASSGRARSETHGTWRMCAQRGDETRKPAYRECQLAVARDRGTTAGRFALCFLGFESTCPSARRHPMELVSSPFNSNAPHVVFSCTARGLKSKKAKSKPARRSAAVAGNRDLALAVRGLSCFIPTLRTHAPRSMAFRPRPPRRREVQQTPRCRVQPPAARDAAIGPETRVAGSFVDTNFMSFFRNSDCVTKRATPAQRSVRSNELMAGRSGLIRHRHLPPGIHMQPQARVANFKLLCDLRFAHGHVRHEKTA